ncbi:hypothetical protein CSUI_006061, partial [Cystoisospora suis]
ASRLLGSPSRRESGVASFFARKFRCKPGSSVVRLSHSVERRSSSSVVIGIPTPRGVSSRSCVVFAFIPALRTTLTTGSSVGPLSCANAESRILLGPSSTRPIRSPAVVRS